MAEDPKIRLQKYLSIAGICSRRHGEELILAGKVWVNGKLVTELGTRVDPLVDTVEIDGKPVLDRQRLLYIALNKPRGYVTSCEQPGEKLVTDLVNVSERIYPIGRLDKDSTGLLLLTNDGPLHHRLSHPSFDHEKEYLVTLAAPIPDSALRKMAEGMLLSGKRTRPAEIHRVSLRRFRIILKEGKNRQIRRMVRKVGQDVLQLHRIRIAGIRLGKLDSGKWRFLDPDEIEALTADR
ncbi:MAG: rRNA pseudouridine synthase [Deltaproteobacteria bacterium]|nr:rRNA pseudouridine synthase [Deltaproteobacteria bacterium]